MGDRRELTFERIEDVMPEVERLMAGHVTSKGWTLGQILHHLSTGIRLSISLRSSSPNIPSNPERERIFKVRRHRFFRANRFPEGAEVPHAVLLPPKDAEEQFEAESLRAAIQLLKEFEEPFPDHPLLGTLSKQEWLDFHRIHCAHHLSFAKVAKLD